MQSVMWLATAGVCGVLLAGCSSGEDPSPSPSPSPSPTPSPVPGPVQGAWDNHLAAFGAGVTAGNMMGDDKTAALDKIMLDYTNQSVVRVFNNEQPMTGVEVYNGLMEIRDMFDGLFTTLNGCNDMKEGNLRLPKPEEQPVVTENKEDSPGSVFLLWQCVSARVNFATDSFIFTGDKIAAQNIVISMPAMKGQVVERKLNEAYAPANVSQAWANHADAFINQQVDQILLDYTEESVVLTFEWTNPAETLGTHKGIAAITTLFEGLFATIGNNTVGFPAGDPFVIQRTDDNAVERSVFLNWNVPGAGIQKATDTFIFGEDLKIKTQTVVTVSDPAFQKTVVV